MSTLRKLASRQDDKQKEYLRRRSLIALAGLLTIGISWLVGGFLVHGFTGVRSIVGDVITIAGLIAGPVIIIVGNVILYRRYADPYPRCQKCGYNLTGNVSGVCPECGTKI